MKLMYGYKQSQRNSWVLTVKTRSNVSSSRFIRKSFLPSSSKIKTTLPRSTSFYSQPPNPPPIRPRKHSTRHHYSSQIRSSKRKNLDLSITPVSTSIQLRRLSQTNLLNHPCSCPWNRMFWERYKRSLKIITRSNPWWEALVCSRNSPTKLNWRKRSTVPTSTRTPTS